MVNILSLVEVKGSRHASLCTESVTVNNDNQILSKGTQWDRQAKEIKMECDLVVLFLHDAYRYQQH